MLGILMIGATVTAFFVALFRNDKRKLFVSLIFTCIVGTTLLILFTRLDAFLYVICIVAMPSIVAVMLLCKSRAASWICWVATLLLIGLAAFGFLMSWNHLYGSAQDFFWQDFKYTFDDIEQYWRFWTHSGDFFGYPDIEPFRIKLNDFYMTIIDFCSAGFWDIHSNTVLVYVIISSLPILAFLVLMIAVSVMRKKRAKILLSARETDCDIVKTQDGYYNRVQHNGCATAGNILSCISYLLTVLGIRFLYYDNDIDISFFTSTGLCIAFIVISLICGFIAWLLLRYAIGYGYEMGAIAKAIYIWSWIPAIIIIAVIIITMIIVCAFGGAEFSTVANKRIYKVIDENGEVRTLDYNGKDIYAKCKDDKGELWETFDGGKTFRKCDLYKIKDDNGQDKYIYDVSGGGKSIFTDGQGGTYESDDGGMTIVEQKD